MNSQNIADPKIKTLFTYLAGYCNKNGINLKYKRTELKKGLEVLIVHTNYDQFGSIGFDKDGKFKCVVRDRKRYKWARCEGFTEDQIFSEDFLEPVLQEVSLEYLASVLIEK